MRIVKSELVNFCKLLFKLLRLIGSSLIRKQHESVRSFFLHITTPGTRNA